MKTPLIRGSFAAHHRSILSPLAAVALAAFPFAAHAQTWTGGGTNGTELGDAANWGGTLPSVAGGTGLFNGTVVGDLALTYGNTSFTGAAGNAGVFFALTNTQTGAVAIDGGANTNALRIGGVFINAGAGAFTLGDGAGTFFLTLGGAPSIQGFTNNSSNLATLKADLAYGLGGGGAHTNKFDGTGNWLSQNNWSNSSGTMNIWKAGAGTLTLAGTNSITGSTLVTAGTIEQTGPKTGAGALVVSNGLYIVPAGVSVYASGTSYVGQFSGAGTMTMATNSVLRTASEVQVSGSAVNGGTGTGLLTMNGATATLSALTIGRGNNNTANMVGTVNVNAGSTLTSTNDLILGFAGATGTKGILNVNGGSVDVGAAGARWMIMGYYDIAHSEVNVSSGSLKLLNGTEIKFSRGNTGTASTNTITQTGGEVTYYSDGGSTVGGTGSLDLAYSGSATARNTYNLNGGTLTVPRVISSTALPARAFNFNGGVLRAAVSTNSWLNIGTGTANVRDGGAIIDDNGLTVTIPQALVHSTIGGDAATDGGLTKRGSGALTLSGANTYNGATAVNAGSLTVSGSIVSAATVSSNATLNIAGTSSQPVTVNRGTFNLTGTVNSTVTVNSNGIVKGTGTNTSALTLNSGATLTANTDGTYLTANGVNITGLTTLAFGGSTTNGSTYNIVKYGAGGILGTNLISSPFRVLLTDDTTNQIIKGLVTTLSIGWAGGDGIWTNGGGTNWTDGNQFYAGDNVTFGDTGTSNAVTVAGSVLPNATVVSGANNYTFVGTGAIAGSGSITKSGNGTLTINTANTYTGGTIIGGGKVILGSSSALGATTNLLTFTGPAILDLNGIDTTIGGATGSLGTILNNGVTRATLTVSSATNSAVDAVIADGSNVTAFVRSGAGTVTLTATNTYTGPTTNSSGTLTVAGLLGAGNYTNLIANAAVLCFSNSATQILGGNQTGLGALLKQGEGSLVLTGTNSYSAPIFRGGVSAMPSGVHTVSGELTVGGVIANGGAGTNTTLTVSGNSIVNVGSWLSVGKGNGIGGVSSDLVLSGSSTLTTGNLSQGWDGGNVANMARGSVTVNDNAALTVNGNFYIGESTGSQMAMTLNGNANVVSAATGSTVTYVGFYGSGTLTVNGGNFRAKNLSLGGANSATAEGKVSVTAGTVRALDWLVLGLNGSALTHTNRVTISSGAVNVGSGPGNGVLLHQINTNSSELNISGGSLNVWSNAWITAHPSWASGHGDAVINQTGGSVTFYSDAGTTLAGTNATSYLNMQGAANAESVSNSTTYNLDGGVLTVPRVTSTVAAGSRTFNFNGGTIKPTINSTNFFDMGSGSVANVRNGGVILDDTGHSLIIPQALTHSAIGGDNAVDGGFTKSGSGTVVLTGYNTYSGPTRVNAGALVVSGDLGGDISAGAGGTIGGSAVTAGKLVLDTNSALIVDPANPYAYITASNGVDILGTMQVAFSGTPAGGVEYTLFNYGTNTVTGTNFITSPYYRLSITNDPARQAVLAMLAAQDLVWNSGSGIWITNGGTNWSGGLVFYSGDNVVFTNSPGAAIVTVDGEVKPSTMLVDADTSYTFSGAGTIGGSVTLTKSGSGTMTLANSNNYTGGTVLNAGQLDINNAYAIGTNTLTINGGAIDNTSGAALALATSNALAWDADFAFIGSNDLNMAPGAVTVGGGGDRIVTLGGGKTLTVGKITASLGGLTLAGNGVLAIRAPADQPGGNSTVAGILTVGTNAVVQFNTGTNLATTADLAISGLAGNGIVRNGGTINRWLLLTENAENTFYGSVQDSPLATATEGFIGLWKKGVGTVTLAGTNTISDWISVDGGGTLRLLGPNTASNYGQVHLGFFWGGGTASTLVLGHTNAVGPVAKLVRFDASGSTLVFATDGNDVVNNLTFGTGTTANIISDRATPGAGISHVLSTDSYADGLGGGTVYVTSGTNVTSGSGRIVFPQLSLGAGTIQTTTIAPTTADVTISNAWKANNDVSQTLGLGGTASDNHVTGSIANGPSLTGTNAVSVDKSGSSTWYLSGSNSYKGPTTVNMGTLFINGNNSSATGEVTVNSSRLGGGGSIGGNVTLSGASYLTPGSTTNSIGSMTVLGILASDVTSTMVFDVAGNGINDAVVAGGLALYGTVQVVFDGAYTPAAGDTFDLIGGTISGSPSLNLPTLATNLVWQTNNFTSLGVVSIASATPPGPTNAYGVWLTNYPTLGTYTNATDDPDGDGFNNGTEFAFDGNPTAGTPALLKATKSGTNLVFSFVANNSVFPTNYTVLSATNLKVGPFVTNAPVTASITNSADQSGVLLTNDYTRKEFHVPVSGTGEYFRVQSIVP